MYTIGEFSKITGLTVKALRFYHDKGLLVPAFVDERTGYRHYDVRLIEKARVIVQLRNLDFTLEQIAEMLAACDDQADLLEAMQRQRELLAEKVSQYRGMLAALDALIHQEKEARMAAQHSSFEVEEKTLPSLLTAGVRMQGRYCECSRGFSTIGRNFGRQIAGPCFLLHYDNEYKEDDADFEACMPLKKRGKEVAGVLIRELPGGKCVSLVHKGPYEALSRSYARIISYIKQKGYDVILPTREVYRKGPGMIFKGNPKEYLTEIQMMVKE